MRRSPLPSGPARPLTVGALTLLLLPASLGLAGAAPATSADRPAPVATDRVQLTRDAGSDVRAAEVGLAPGLSRLETSPYSMVAATWRGPAPRVEVRTAPGEPWRRLPPLEDGPSVGAGEGTPGVSGTDLVWTGTAQDIDVRVTGTGHRDLELVLVEPGPDPASAVAARERRTAGERAEQQAAADAAPQPAWRSRDDWGADPRWRNGRPRYTKPLRQVHLHHTATGNTYTRADVPGLIRGMYRYHTQSLGWFDIGYNFLVDRFGRIWVGRSGGPQRLVRGAHTLGFNEQSVGIATIGTFTSAKPTVKAVNAIIKLAAWKLDDHGRRATGRVRMTSTGSDRYRAGARPRLPVIDGHRDTNETACPGRRLYEKLPGIRTRTQRRIERFG